MNKSRKFTSKFTCTKSSDSEVIELWTGSGLGRRQNGKEKTEIRFQMRENIK